MPDTSKAVGSADNFHSGGKKGLSSRILCNAKVADGEED